tara:strand:+ start:3633 stop:4241 length:609 start_codon:yes stop_codon:yes gene_type:complete
MKYKLIEISEIKSNEINIIKDIIYTSNENTLIAQLGKKFIIKFLKLCINSQKANLYVYKDLNKNIISYAIFFKKQEYINKEIRNIKFTIILTILARLKINLIYDIILIYLNRDLKLLDKDKFKILKNSVNLTYLAVDEKYRNQGIGKAFLDDIIYKNYKNSSISVETDNKKTLNFYEKYMKFKLIGTRTRSKKNLYLLIKTN